MAPCPAFSPTWNNFSPMAVSKAFAGFKTSGVAAAIMVRVPAWAPTTPPETGASMNRCPDCSIRSASWATSFGGQVAIKTTVAPLGSAAKAPASNRTLSACAILTTISTSASAPLATSGADAAICPPALASAARASCFMSKPVTWNCLRTRFSAMGKPIAPRPTKPI